MHAAVVTGSTGRLIVETAVHCAAGGESCRDAINIVRVGIVLGIQDSNKGSISRRPKGNHRRVKVPIILDKPNNATRSVIGIADRGGAVGQPREGILLNG